MNPVHASRNCRPALAGLFSLQLPLKLLLKLWLTLWLKWSVVIGCGIASLGLANAAQAAKAAESRSVQGVQGVVSKVTDGDSLWLTPAGKPPMEVRLRDIDAPERCQPWGHEARAALAELALNKVATLQTSGRDSYGRTLGVLMIDDINVGKFLVENGHAWSTRSRWDQGPLVKQEKMARALSRGLHGTPGAVQPVEFRRTHGQCVAGEAINAAAAPAGLAARGPSAVRATAVDARCDGRTHCAQMSSCEEARYFLAHCPDVKMDGNRDGVPCEMQWCKR